MSDDIVLGRGLLVFKSESTIDTLEVESPTTGAVDTPAVLKTISDGYLGVDIVKASAEQHYTLGVAYPAMKVDVAVAKDGHRDFISKEALEKAAWNWMAKSGGVNLHHRSGTDGHAAVVESYIYRGPDWAVKAADGSEYVIKAGDWMLGTVWDDHGWSLVKSGLVNGWSPEGGARRKVPSADQLSKLRS